MKHLVLLKVVPDTEALLQIDEEKKEVVLDHSVEWIIDPYVENALEEAIRTKEKHGGEVVILCAGDGSKSEEAVIRKALAMGADKAIHIVHENLKQADGTTTANVLLPVVEREKPDIVWAGMRSYDVTNAQVPVEIAVKIKYPIVINALSFELQDNKAIITRLIPGGAQEKVEVELPAVITTDQAINEPRYPKLPDIMKAKRKPIEKLTPEELGVSLEPLQHYEKVKIYFPPKKEGGRILKGDLKDQIKELVRILVEEEKVL